MSVALSREQLTLYASWWVVNFSRQMTPSSWMIINRLYMVKCKALYFSWRENEMKLKRENIEDTCLGTICWWDCQVPEIQRQVDGGDWWWPCVGIDTDITWDIPHTGHGSHPDTGYSGTVNTSPAYSTSHSCRLSQFVSSTDPEKNTRTHSGYF